MRRMVASLFLTLAMCAAGCAMTDRVALYAERSMIAGSDALDRAVDAKIAECRAKDLPTAEERAACVEDVAKLLDGADPAVHATVAALRAYWAARAAGDMDRARQALAAAKAAARSLPPEYFAGLQDMMEKAVRR